MVKKGLKIWFFVVCAVVVCYVIYLHSKISTAERGPCPPDCNVILISIDSLRADALTQYGGEKVVAPYLEDFFEKSVYFENYITPAYLTPISEMALHTGLHPLESGVTRFDSALPKNTLTLAQILKEKGYKTVAIGSSPEFFHFNRGLRNAFSRGFDEYYTQYDEVRKRGDEGYQHLRVAPQEAIEWLTANDPEDTFFMWLTVGTVHWPYARWDFPTKESYATFLKNDKREGEVTMLSWWGLLKQMYQGSLWSLRESGTKLKDLTEDDQNYILDGYDSNITYTDTFLGEFFSNLQKKGYLENTIVIIHSEHGEDMGEHGYYAHYDIFDTTVRTPLAFYVPGVPSRGVDGLASTVNVLPTLLDFLYIDPPQTAKEKSLARVITGEVPSTTISETYITRIPFWEHVISWVDASADISSHEHEKNLLTKLKELDALDRETPIYDVAIRTDEWKLIWRKGRDYEEKYGWFRIMSGQEDTIEEYELYHLPSDPNEQINVYAEHPEVVEVLLPKLHVWEETQRTKSAPPKREGVVQPYF